MALIDNPKREHDWALLGKVGAAVGIPVGLPLIALCFWAGQLSQQLMADDGRLSEQQRLLASIVTLSTQHDERINQDRLDIGRLRDSVDKLIEAQRRSQ